MSTFKTRELTERTKAPVSEIIRIPHSAFRNRRRRFFSLSVLVALACIALASCNSMKKGGGSGAAGGSSASALQVGADGIPRITVDQLRDALNKGTAIIIDTRGVDSYRQRRIKGSINIPLDQMASRINELPRDKLIVTYCS